MADYNDFISRNKRAILRDHKDYMTPELNDWFNLDNYAEVENFNSLDWLWQLEIRFYAICLYNNLLDDFDDFDDFDPKNDYEIEKYYDTHYEHQLALFHLSLDSIRKNPTGDFFTGAKAIELYLTPNKAKAVLSYLEPAVRQLTYLDLMKLTSDKQTVGSGVLNLVVNLNTPHKVLLADFEKLLESQKQNSKLWLDYGKKGKHKPGFESWNKNHLLAYIDISLWVLEKKLKDNSFAFISRDYLKQIDPECVIDAYTISRNKSISSEVLQETYLDYLSHIAIEDMYKK